MQLQGWERTPPGARRTGGRIPRRLRWPCRHLDFWLLASGTKRIHSCCLKPPSLQCFATAARRRAIRGGKGLGEREELRAQKARWRDAQLEGPWGLPTLSCSLRGLELNSTARANEEGKIFEPTEKQYLNQDIWTKRGRARDKFHGPRRKDSPTQRPSQPPHGPAPGSFHT